MVSALGKAGRQPRHETVAFVYSTSSVSEYSDTNTIRHIQFNRGRLPAFNVNPCSALSRWLEDSEDGDHGLPAQNHSSPAILRQIMQESLDIWYKTLGMERKYWMD
jgi:hypothetical protein